MVGLLLAGLATVTLVAADAVRLRWPARRRLARLCAAAAVLLVVGVCADLAVRVGAMR